MDIDKNQCVPVTSGCVIGPCQGSVVRAHAYEFYIEIFVFLCVYVFIQKDLRFTIRMRTAHVYAVILIGTVFIPVPVAIPVIGYGSFILGHSVQQLHDNCLHKRVQLCHYGVCV